LASSVARAPGVSRSSLRNPPTPAGPQSRSPSDEVRVRARRVATGILSVAPASNNRRGSGGPVSLLWVPLLRCDRPPRTRSTDHLAVIEPIRPTGIFTNSSRRTPPLGSPPQSRLTPAGGLPPVARPSDPRGRGDRGDQMEAAGRAVEDGIAVTVHSPVRGDQAVNGPSERFISSRAQPISSWPYPQSAC
jgi:hypothetical protein